jgi:hypothetical protein
LNPSALATGDKDGDSSLLILVGRKDWSSKLFPIFEVFAKSPNFLEALMKRSNEGATPLHFACDGFKNVVATKFHDYQLFTPRDKDIIRTLLTAYPDAVRLLSALKVEDAPSRTPLFLACYGTWSSTEEADEVVNMLLDAYPEAASLQSTPDLYPLMPAIVSTSLKTIERIYTLCPEAVRFVSDFFGTALHAAAATGDVEKITYIYSLFPEAVDIEISQGSDSHQGTPLSFLVYQLFRTRRYQAVVKPAIDALRFLCERSTAVDAASILFVYNIEMADFFEFYAAKNQRNASTAINLLWLQLQDEFGYLLKLCYGSAGAMEPCLCSTLGTDRTFAPVAAAAVDAAADAVAAAAVPAAADATEPLQTVLSLCEAQPLLVNAGVPRFVLTALPDADPVKLRNLNYAARRGAMALLLSPIRQANPDGEMSLVQMLAEFGNRNITRSIVSML